MIKKFLLFIFLFVTSLYSYESLDISKSQDTLGHLYCVEDKTRTLTFEDIYKSEVLKKVPKSNLGYSFSTFWCKIDIHNDSKENKEFIYYNARPAMDILDVKIYGEAYNKILNLGDMKALENRDLKSIFSNFKLNLEANEKATIITKYQSLGNVELNWTMESIEEFISSQNIIFTLMFLYIGFMAAIMFQKLFTFYFIRDKIYIIYALFVFSAIIANMSNIGSMHYFFFEYLNGFTINVLGSTFSHVFLATLWIFTYYFFQIDRKSKFFYLFAFIIAYNILIVFAYLYSYIDIRILAITPLVLLIALIESLILLIVSIIMYFKKKPGSSLFLLAHIAYVGSIIYYILSLSGGNITPIMGNFISTAGIFLATYFMSLSLSSRFKVLKDENDRIKLEVEKNKQFTLIGTTISYVTHQWKQPISILSSQIMRIEALIDHKPETKVIELKDDVKKINENMYFINDTLTNIKTLFKIDTSNKANFELIETLNLIKLSFEDILLNNSISIDIDIKEEKTIYGNQNLFIHAIKNILQNSIDAIYDKNIVNTQILISSSNENLLTIEDFAGGINKEILENLFEKTTSSKENGMGIGLSITKDIIEKEFKSTINVEKTNNGTRFIIK